MQLEPGPTRAMVRYDTIEFYYKSHKRLNTASGLPFQASLEWRKLFVMYFCMVLYGSEVFPAYIYCANKENKFNFFAITAK